MKPIVQISGFLRYFLAEILLSITLGIAAIAAGIGLLGTSAYIIASAALQPSIATLQVAIVGVRFFGITRGVFRYFERLVSHSVNLRLVARLREVFFRRIEPGAPANLTSLHGGDVLQRVMGDLEVLENFYVRVLAPLVIAVVIVIGTSFFVGDFALELGIVLFAGMVATGVLHPLLALVFTRKPSENLVLANAAGAKKWVELLQGLEDIQSCNAQPFFYKPLIEDINRMGQLQNRLNLLKGINSGLGLLLMNLTLLAILWVAIPMVNTGILDGVSLAVITLVVLAGFEAVNPLPAAAHYLKASRAAAQRIFAFAKPDQQSGLYRFDQDLAMSRSIQFEGIDLLLENDMDPVLKGISFELAKGKKVALVGASGAGKTSLINLLAGFQQARVGRITADGRDLKQVDPDTARSLFAVLPQQVYLFNGDIRENLLLANPQALDDALLDVIDRTGLREWFQSQPDGLETWIGERGVKMSGGERQRLGAARVLLQDRPFILLDEPTANLDQLTGGQLMRSLFIHAEGRGLFLITHDLTWLAAMDEILLIEEGKIIERGSYTTLINSQGAFSRFFRNEKNRLPDG